MLYNNNGDNNNDNNNNLKTQTVSFFYIQIMNWSLQSKICYFSFVYELNIDKKYMEHRVKEKWRKKKGGWDFKTIYMIVKKDGGKIRREDQGMYFLQM